MPRLRGVRALRTEGRGQEGRGCPLAATGSPAPDPAGPDLGGGVSGAPRALPGARAGLCWCHHCCYPGAAQFQAPFPSRLEEGTGISEFHGKRPSAWPGAWPRWPLPRASHRRGQDRPAGRVRLRLTVGGRRVRKNTFLKYLPDKKACDQDIPGRHPQTEALQACPHQGGGQLPQHTEPLLLLPKIHSRAAPPQLVIVQK